MSLESDKAELRRRVLSACREIPSEQAKRSAERVAQHVVSSSELEGAGTIGFYAATAAEIATRPIFEASRGAGKCCVFPRCQPERRLEFAKIDHWEQLSPGRFGLLEPAAGIVAIGCFSIRNVRLSRSYRAAIGTVRSDPPGTNTTVSIAGSSR